MQPELTLLFPTRPPRTRDLDDRCSHSVNIAAEDCLFIPSVNRPILTHTTWAEPALAFQTISRIPEIVVSNRMDTDSLARATVIFCVRDTVPG
jgi:hypothetical protein